MEQLVQFLARNAGLVLVLGLVLRLPPFERLFYHDSQDEKTQVLFTLFWSLAAVLATYIAIGSAYVPLLAGRYGGLRPGLVVGLLVGGTLNVQGGSLATVMLHLGAGLLGGFIRSRLEAGQPSPWWLALVAGLVSLVAMDVPDHPGDWLVIQAASGDWPLVASLAVTFTIADGVFIKLMEYLMAEGERQTAQMSTRMLALADRAGELARGGWSHEAASRLCHEVRQELQVESACLVSAETILAFEGKCAHLHLADEVTPQSGPHQNVFASCPAECHLGHLEVVPLGEDAWLGLLDSARKVLSPSGKKAAEALGTVLSGMRARARMLEQKAALEESRHRFLQAQIRPHFLFNTLNTIAALSKDAESRELVVLLADFLRESFHQDRHLVDLERELEIVDCYLAIEKKRFRDRLEIRRQLPDPLQPFQIPPFSLQPLIENAVLHGVSHRTEQGWVSLTLDQSDGLVITIEDSGPGIPPEALEHQSDGIGLANVSQRLRHHFGQRLKFDIEGSKITISIERSDDENPDCR